MSETWSLSLRDVLGSLVSRMRSEASDIAVLSAENNTKSSNQPVQTERTDVGAACHGDEMKILERLRGRGLPAASRRARDARAVGRG
jgi:hypothetical protein